MQYRNAHRQFGGQIDCEINHPQFGWIPFTADLDDTGAAFDVAALHAEMDADPATADYVEPAPDLADLEAEARAKRNALLTASDWTQVLDAPVNKTAWAAYRQELRDVPQQEGFPETVNWPTPPAG